ncbi:hypothetical protein BC834DRAFT_973700 [Gloeopeniophorella convolvens]|nr:hypothetical protein BC834DRAFT_973700 [Gloeopeniophorella convolvens]
MDVMNAFPRTMFSESQLGLVRWAMTQLGVPEMPSVQSTKRQRDSVLRWAGNAPMEATSTHGNLYSAASLSHILAHEMSNPLRYEVDPNTASPMARASDGQDYFVHEPALANVDQFGTVAPVWIERWFQKGGRLFARIHRLSTDPSQSHLIIEEGAFDIALSSFVMSFPTLQVVHARYGLPAPTTVTAIRRVGADGTLSVDDYHVQLPNPWRVKANGRRVLSLPLWLYCDDTSGNLSKKWNEHNSFLVVLAGLEQAYALLPFNIHFVATSNVASPLEMAEEVAAQLRHLHENGLAAWDCKFNEEVLTIPWPLAGLGDNPMLNSPVEILHVVLLGVVKSFWRDAVARCDPHKKAILKARLSSLETFDLGLSPIRGQTLVKYAGSLTGRDFRVIMQVGPAVLHGLLPAVIWDAWLALCRLGPLVFQPMCNNLDEYKKELEDSINDLLLTTAQWTTSWFKKPKFHVILHLPEHVVRLAPAILMATEGFESFNHVIRLRSVHSNRQAPSKDIASSMNFLHAARHLISGGVVFPTADSDSTSRRQAGKGVLELVNDPVFAHLIGITPVRERRCEETMGFYARPTRRVQASAPLQWSSTMAFSAAGMLCPPIFDSEGHPPILYEHTPVPNKDKARIGSFVLFRAEGDNTVHLGRVLEIVGSPEEILFITLEVWVVRGVSDVYRMPEIQPADSRHHRMAKVKDVLCCAHTFHNCQNNGCTVKRTRRVHQERQETALLDFETAHSRDAYDRILNTAQLRSAAAMRQFYLTNKLQDQTREEAGDSLPQKSRNEIIREVVIRDFTRSSRTAGQPSFPSPILSIPPLPMSSPPPPSTPSRPPRVPQPVSSPAASTGWLNDLLASNSDIFTSAALQSNVTPSRPAKRGPDTQSRKPRKRP